MKNRRLLDHVLLHLQLPREFGQLPRRCRYCVLLRRPSKSAKRLAISFEESRGAQERSNGGVILLLALFCFAFGWSGAFAVIFLSILE